MKWMAAWALVALAGCGFRPLVGDDMAGDDLANPTGSGGDLAMAMGGGTGPGPWGALPTGYCCASNADCRDRNCQAFGCTDECLDDDTCNALPGYHCVGATMFDPGTCQPVQMATACTPSSQFHYGGKKLGDCCVATHDGMSGLECEGGRCDASGADSNPYICTNVCTKAADCPGNYLCLPLVNFKVCTPVSDPYTCK
jgi:hypothetical protein